MPAKPRPFALPASVTARYIARPNRFTVECRLDTSGETVNAHLPNPGRLYELLLPEVRLWLLAATNPLRKMAYSVLAAERDG